MLFLLTSMHRYGVVIPGPISVGRGSTRAMMVLGLPVPIMLPLAVIDRPEVRSMPLGTMHTQSVLDTWWVLEEHSPCDRSSGLLNKAD